MCTNICMFNFQSQVPMDQINFFKLKAASVVIMSIMFSTCKQALLLCSLTCTHNSTLSEQKSVYVFIYSVQPVLLYE